LSKNKIKALTVFCGEDSFPNLKWLDVSHNKLVELPGIKLPKLEYLDISSHKMEKVNEAWTGHPNLRIFKSFDNKFKSISQFKSMPKLEELYLGSNQITVLGGYEGIPAVKILHLRRNKIEKLEDEVPPLESLVKINLRSNCIKNFEILEKLLKNEKLVDLNILNNPLETNTSSFNVLMSEVLAKNTRIQRFCKVDTKE